MGTFVKWTIVPGESFPSSVEVIGHQVDPIKVSSHGTDFVGAINVALPSSYGGSQQQTVAVAGFLVEGVPQSLHQLGKLLLVVCWASSVAWVLPI